MREGWEVKKWSDVLEIRSGRNQKAVENPNGKYQILGSAGKIMGYADKYICEENTTIIGRKGTINTPLLIKEKFWNVDTAFGLHALELLDKMYLFYFCQNFDFRELDKGSGRPSLVKSDLLKIQIPIPPLLEQKQIVKTLDLAFKQIDQAKVNLEKNLVNAKELFASKLNEVFSQRGEGWVEKTLKEITSLLGDGLHGTPKYNDEGEYFFINGNNLNNGKIIFKEKTKRVTVDEYNKYKKNLNSRTVFVSINGTLGNVAFYNNEKVILGKSACYFNLLEDIDKSFIKYFLLSPSSIKYLHSSATGATIKNVSLKTMRAFKIYLPSLEKQIAIVKELESFETYKNNLINSYQQNLNNLEELKKSILQKAFRGEL